MKLIPENEDEVQDLACANSFADKFYNAYKDVFGDNAPGSFKTAHFQKINQLNAGLALVLLKWLQPNKWKEFYADLEKTLKYS